jgi:hypothetical protein
MSKLENRLSELDSKNIKSKRCYDMAKRRIKGGYNGHIEILISECASDLNAEDEHYAY